MHNKDKHELFPFAFAIQPPMMSALLATPNAIGLDLVGLITVTKKYFFKDLIGER
jgi:hypothetical protein